MTVRATRSPLCRLLAAALVTASVLSMGLALVAAPAGADTHQGEDEAPVEVVRDIVFPVVGPVRYSDTFGACRSGCRRSHAGEDLMAAKLTPLVATTDAVVHWIKGSATPDGSQGNYVMLRDADGWEYWYIHLNNDTPGTDDGANPPEWRFGPGIERGAEVKAGQLIGFVGDSGNAEWTAPHVHFEIHQPDGSVINPNPSLDAAIRLDAPLGAEDDFSGYERFVEALAIDFLDRPAEPATAGLHVAELRAGAPRAAIVARFAASDEWVGALLTRYYESTLGRRPDHRGLQYWTGVLAGGTTPAEVAAHFYASEEYFRRSGDTAEAWVTDLYHELLERSPDAGGLDHWVSAIEAGASRSSVASDFYGSIESRRRRVLNLYLDLLGRRPDAGGHAYWAEILANGRDIELATQLAASPEYFNRSLRRDFP